MNSLVVRSSTVKAPQFIVGTKSALTLAYAWGAEDGAKGIACVPEMQFIKSKDQRDYAAGWAAVRGETETTRHFTGGNR